MATTGVSGDWKYIQGTMGEVLSELNTDDVKWDDLDSFTHDGTNFVALYYQG